MNRIQVRQVESALVRDYTELLDLRDVEQAGDQQRDKVLRTRALAAEALRQATNIAKIDAAAAVTDGSGDNGLDAVYVDVESAEIVLVQSKWHSSGTGSIGIGETHAFLQGFRDLTDENFDRFNAKIRALEGMLHDAIGAAGLTLRLILVTSGSSDLAPEVKRLVDDALEEMNQDTQMLKVEVMGLQQLRDRLASDIAGDKITLRSVVIENYGSLSEPYQAYYGVVDGLVLRDWYENHGDSLFSKNIRKSLGGTGVNLAVQETVEREAAHFWYYNNGVTILCDKIVKTLRGASSRNFGEFDLEGASVVNGAQTVASLATALKDTEDSSETPKIWVRAISLEGCPEGFAADVTRATNTQNTVESRDFVSLDDEQLRLRTDFRLSLNKSYSIKRGEKAPDHSEGCSVTEAAIALACMQSDSQFAVIAKSAPGRLWDMQGRYYRQLFNPETNALLAWRAVQVMRWVDSALDGILRDLPDGRPRAVNVQGNRMVLWAVLQTVDRAKIVDPETDWESLEGELKTMALRKREVLYNLVEKDYPTNYITSLFKNASRCKELEPALTSKN